MSSQYWTPRRGLVYPSVEIGSRFLSSTSECKSASARFLGLWFYSLPQIRRQRELPRTSEVCPYIMKDLIQRLRKLFVLFPGVRAIFGVVIYVVSCLCFCMFGLLGPLPLRWGHCILRYAMLYYSIL